MGAKDVEAGGLRTDAVGADGAPSTSRRMASAVCLRTARFSSSFLRSALAAGVALLKSVTRVDRAPSLTVASASSNNSTVMGSRGLTGYFSQFWRKMGRSSTDCSLTLANLAARPASRSVRSKMPRGVSVSLPLPEVVR